MRKYLFAALLVLSLPAFAQAASQTLSYTWVAPTTRADGSTLPLSQLSGYELTYAVDGSAPVLVPISGGSTTSATVTLNLAAKANPYVLVSTLKAVDIFGLKSTPATLTTNITVSPAIPGPPGNFKLIVTCNGGACTLVIQ